MQYCDFGNTGARVSAPGFGAMRLPEEKVNGKYRVKEEESIEIIQRAFSPYTMRRSMAMHAGHVLPVHVDNMISGLGSTASR